MEHVWPTDGAVIINLNILLLSLFLSKKEVCSTIRGRTHYFLCSGKVNWVCLLPLPLQCFHFSCCCGAQRSAAGSFCHKQANLTNFYITPGPKPNQKFNAGLGDFYKYIHTFFMSLSVARLGCYCQLGSSWPTDKVSKFWKPLGTESWFLSVLEKERFSSVSKHKLGRKLTH